jgi:purine-cytosine permease-like protein
MRVASFPGRLAGAGRSSARALVTGARALVNRLREHPPRLPAEFSRDRIATQLSDDYSGRQSEPVPASARQPWWHLTALWITLAAGVAELALGFRFYQAGYSLARAVAASAAGAGCYLAYALPAACLGSRTGRTTAAATRPVFGATAAGVISLLLAVAAVARVAVASVVLAAVWQALFGGGHLAVVVVAVAAAVAGAAPSLLGFTGMAAFARYAAAPVMLAWAGYLVARGIQGTPDQVLLGGPKVSAALPFAAAVSLAAAVTAWGNEPDTWRYSRPRFAWPLAPYLAALAAGLVLFVAGGWVMASMSQAGGGFDLGRALRSGAGYSVFGALWLGAAVVMVMQVARAAAGYYQMTNAVRNLAGPLRRRSRWQVSVLLMVVSALVTWAVITLGITAAGLARVLLWSAVVLPCVVVVMCAEVFVLPRLLAARDPGERERQVSQAGPGSPAALPVNWPAIVSVVAGAVFGGYGLGLLPAQHALPPAGFAPAEAWLLAGVVYTAIGVARAARASSRLAPARPERAGGTRRKAASAQVSPRGMLEAIRSDATAEAGENQFLALIAGGQGARERLALFAVQQARLRSSDRRSFLYLASRSNGPASSFFAGLADTERHALDLLAVFAEALTGRKGPPAGGDALPGCQAYPSFVAWLALNAPPADAALALAANMVTWSGQFAAMARALRQNPGLGLDARAYAFFDLIATPEPQVETQALAVVQAYMDTGWPPDRARGYGRMLRSYAQMFWVAMAEAPVPAGLPAGAAGQGDGRNSQGA